MLSFAFCLVSPGALAKQPPLAPPVQPPDPPGMGVLNNTHPGQLQGVVPPPLVGPGPFRRLPLVQDGDWVIVATRKVPYWKAGTFDPVLTNACRRGEFATLPSNLMVVRFTAPDGAAALQVVVPTHRHLLADQRKLAKAGETYFFFDSGQPDCQVWINGKAVPRKLDPTRGTSLPKADPQAQKKKKALIDSWPKPE